MVLFLLALMAAGQDGVRSVRFFVVALVAFVLLGFLLLVRRFQQIRADGTARMVRLLRAGRVDEAVRVGREQVEATPADQRLLWNYTAALIKSGHLAEARRIFAQIRPDSLPPKMAAMYGEVRTALETGTAGPEAEGARQVEN
jgi:hypothetical protein